MVRLPDTPSLSLSLPGRHQPSSVSCVLVRVCVYVLLYLLTSRPTHSHPRLPPDRFRQGKNSTSFQCQDKEKHKPLERERNNTEQVNETNVVPNYILSILLPNRIQTR